MSKKDGSILMPSPKALPALQHDEETLIQLEGWEKHYRDEFGLKLDFSGILIPVRRDWTKRLIVVAEGMNCKKAFNQNAKTFPSDCCYEDPNMGGFHNDREPGKSYAIWIRGNIEADKDCWMNANQARAWGILGTTLLEDLLMELKYYRETAGGHLNCCSETRCDGSRCYYSLVPSVQWFVGEFYVGYCELDARWSSRCHSRRVVAV